MEVEIKESADEILNLSLDQYKNKNISVVAGHYCVAPDLTELSNDGESEIFSFKTGVYIYKKLKETSNNPSLILWINDIGIDTQERKKLKEEYVIPANYQQILAENDISIDHVDILFESTARNKASVLFRKIYKKESERYQIFSSNDKSLIRCIENDQCTIEEDKKAYTILSDENERIVVKEGSNPKCNLILATLFKSIINKKKSDVILNIFNDIYVDRIRLGTYVGKYVFQLNNVDFINYFCDEDSLFKDI